MNNPGHFPSFSAPKALTVPSNPSSVLTSIEIFSRDDKAFSIPTLLGISMVTHLATLSLLALILFLLQFLGIHIPLFDPPQFKDKDIEFTIVQNPEEKPRNPHTRMRSEHATRAGGIRTPNLHQAEQIRSAGAQASKPSPAPSQPQPEHRVTPHHQTVVAHKSPGPKAPQPQPTQKPQQTAQKQPPTPQPPTPKLPTPHPTVADVPSPVPPTIKMPAAKAPSGPRMIATGPVVHTPIPSGGGGDSGESVASPTAIPSAGSPSGGHGRRGGHTGGGGAGSYDQSGSPGVGGGRSGIDSLPAPDYGAYMAELQRRIKRNWKPPSAQEDKRVVVHFTIGRDGRLLSCYVQHSSGFPEADAAAMSAVRLSAPFRPLPPGHRDPDLAIQFTFDYNVYRGGSAGMSYR